jgi:cytochrome b pre-mRNA-processing protein 3
MSFLSRFFGRSGKDPKDVLRPLYAAIIAKARQPHWYMSGGVEDSIDGRFEMVAAMLAQVYMRLEDATNGTNEEAQSARNGLVHLTELFVEDMEGQFREIGIGDVLVGKHMGRVTSAFGGRLGAYRRGFADRAELGPALIRNMYRGDPPPAEALAHVQNAMRDANEALSQQHIDEIMAGELRW